MNEFNNRIDAQRSILHSVNMAVRDEELFGLSSKAIERWVSVNRLDPTSNLVRLVRAAAEQLFFLANKSQEQVTNEYKLKTERIVFLANEIDVATCARTSLPRT